MCMFHRHNEYLQKYAKWNDKEGENIELGPTREAAHSLIFWVEANFLKALQLATPALWLFQALFLVGENQVTIMRYDNILYYR